MYSRMYSTSRRAPDALAPFGKTFAIGEIACAVAIDVTTHVTMVNRRFKTSMYM